MAFSYGYPEDPLSRKTRIKTRFCEAFNFGFFEPEDPLSRKTRIKTRLMFPAEKHNLCQKTHYPEKQGLRRLEEITGSYIISRQKTHYPEKQGLRLGESRKASGSIRPPEDLLSRKTRIKTSISIC